jgi:hypothetical protein
LDSRSALAPIVPSVLIMPIVTVGDRLPALTGRRLDQSVEFSLGRGRICDLFIVE